MVTVFESNNIRFHFILFLFLLVWHICFALKMVHVKFLKYEITSFWLLTYTIFEDTLISVVKLYLK